MRIGISGSAGVGKTELADKISEHFRLPLMRDDVRKYLAEKKVTLEQARLDLKKFQSDLLDRRIMAEAKYSDGFVSDRTSIDNLAYSLFHAGPDNDWLGPYYETCLETAWKYDLIIYLPWGCVPAEEDGVRNTNKWYNLAISSIISGILTLFGNVLNLTGVPADDWFCRVAEYIIRRR